MDERKLMTTIAALIVLAAGVLLWLSSPSSPFAAQADPGEGGNTTWQPGVKVERQPYVSPGGLYHPPGSGAGRTALMNWGWDWIASPPGEAEVGLGRAG